MGLHGSVLGPLAGVTMSTAVLGLDVLGLSLGRNKGGSNGQSQPQSSVRTGIMSVLLITVAGWVPQQGDSEREVCIQEVYWGGHWDGRVGETGLGRQKLNCNAVATKDSAGPVENSGAGDGPSELSQIETSGLGLSGHPPIDLSWMKAALRKEVKPWARWFSSAEIIPKERVS